MHGAKQDGGRLAGQEEVGDRESRPQVGVGRGCGVLNVVGSGVRP